MESALAQIGQAKQLVNTGQFIDVVNLLEGESPESLQRSPTLALLKGTAHARLGDYEEGQKWVHIALEGSRKTADDHLEARALNVLGAIAFERGQIDEAELHFSRGLEAATRIDDATTMGRCANNLGIIANLQGDHLRAVASHTRALTAFERIGSDRGAAETLNNMGISYRGHGDYVQALSHADRAVQAATSMDDPVLLGQLWAGRAEIRVRMGDAPLALREAEIAMSMHQKTQDAIGEMETLRILALALSATGNLARAELTLLDVIQRAESFERPLLAADARRNLAEVLAAQGRHDEVREVAQRARAQFVNLGAMGQARSLDAWLIRDGEARFPPNPGT